MQLHVDQMQNTGKLKITIANLIAKIANFSTKPAFKYSAFDDPKRSKEIFGFNLTIQKL